MEALWMFMDIIKKLNRQKHRSKIWCIRTGARNSSETFFFYFFLFCKSGTKFQSNGNAKALNQQQLTQNCRIQSWRKSRWVFSYLFSNIWCQSNGEKCSEIREAWERPDFRVDVRKLWRKRFCGQRGFYMCDWTRTLSHLQWICIIKIRQHLVCTRYVANHGHTCRSTQQIYLVRSFSDCLAHALWNRLQFAYVLSSMLAVV